MECLNRLPSMEVVPPLPKLMRQWISMMKMKMMKKTSLNQRRAKTSILDGTSNIWKLRTSENSRLELKIYSLLIKDQSFFLMAYAISVMLMLTQLLTSIQKPNSDSHHYSQRSAKHCWCMKAKPPPTSHPSSWLRETHITQNQMPSYVLLNSYQSSMATRKLLPSDWSSQDF